MDKKIILGELQRCPKCSNPIGAFTDRRRKKTSRADGCSVCTSCGELLMVIDGKI